jgi:type I restriction enzyme S subunit
MKTETVGDAEDHISAEAIKDSATSLVPPDSLLMVTRSGILARTLPIARTTAEVALNQDLKALVPNAASSSAFLAFAIRRFEREILNTCRKSGTTVASIEFPRLLDFEIPLPPLAEQKRIVAKLEELTARSRRAKEALDAVPPLLDQLRQSILAAAFRGDLTADWRAKNPNVEPAEKLLERIRADFAIQRSPRRGTSLVASDLGDLGELGSRSQDQTDCPPKWAWATVGQLCDVGTGATPKRGEPKYWSGGDIPWITSGAANGAYVDAAVEFVTKRALEETNLSIFPPGTLLVAMYGEGQTRGRCAELRIPATTNQALAGLVTTRLPPTLKEVIKFVLWERYEAIRKAAAGGVQPNLNLSIVRGISVPVPPLAEQEVLLGTLAAALAAIERLREQAHRSRESVEILDSSVLAKAFRGELVPQDPNDEPAALLLERLRTTQETIGPKGRGKARGATKSEGLPLALKCDDLVNQPPAQPARITAAAGLTDLDPDTLHDEVFTALWPHGPLDKDAAVRRLADHLRAAGRVHFTRLRADGPLYAELLAAIESTAKAGHLDRPQRNHVRASKPDAASYTTDDWRHALLATLPVDPTDRDDAIRSAAEWAREQLGLQFTRLRSDGHIAEGLRSAITGAIRRGEVTRHGATAISRVAPSPDPRRHRS